MVRSLSRRLSQQGFESRAAADADEAIRKIAARLPDVVLLDVYLGEENGLDHVAAIRAAGFSGPLIVLSGDATFATAHRAAIAGADGYIVKGENGVNPLQLTIRPLRANKSAWRGPSEMTSLGRGTT